MRKYLIKLIRFLKRCVKMFSPYGCVMLFLKYRLYRTKNTGNNLSDNLIVQLSQLEKKYSLSKRFVEINDIEFWGIVFSIPDFPSFYYQLKAIFVEEQYKFFQHGSDENLIIYDCGANVGAVSLYLKKIYNNAKIKCFEADSEVAEYLKKNINNNIDNPNDIEVIEKAVWINNKGVMFNCEGADGGSISNKIYDDRKVITIPSIRLRDILRKESEIDLLKMDIEGAEKKVFIDCKDELYKIKRLVIEYHSEQNQKNNLGEIFSILEDHNFKYFIESVCQLNHPVFINYYHKMWNNMDMQIVIFAINQNFL